MDRWIECGDIRMDGMSWNYNQYFIRKFVVSRKSTFVVSENPYFQKYNF